MIGAEERLQEIKSIWRKNQWLYVLIGFVFGVLFTPFLQLLRNDLAFFLQSLVPEAFGIGFTILLINRFYQNREYQREMRERKSRLLRELRSAVPEIAKRATEELNETGWITDGTLASEYMGGIKALEADWDRAIFKNTEMDYVDFSHASLLRADFQGAELYGSDFPKAILRGASFIDAKLDGTIFSDANLMEVNFTNASMHGADLSKANIQYSCFRNANLYKCNFWDAMVDVCDLRNANLSLSKLFGAYLKDSDLEGANLDGARFDKETMLPDGTYWTEETDMKRFTDPTHKNFWRTEKLTWVGQEVE